MIIFFGDSITRDWPLGEVLDGSRINAGISGETTGQMRERFARDVTAWAPRAVHLLGGINDIGENQGPVSTDEIAANLIAMVDAARAATIGVVIGQLLPCSTFRKRPHLQPRSAVRRLNGWIATLERHDGVVVADYFTPLAAAEDALRPDCTTDGLHPNPAGYAVMSRVARTAFARLERNGVQLASRRA